MSRIRNSGTCITLNLILISLLLGKYATHNLEDLRNASP